MEAKEVKRPSLAGFNGRILRGCFALVVVAGGAIALTLVRPHRRPSPGLDDDEPRSATTVGAGQGPHGASNGEMRRIAELRERVERILRAAGAAARAEQQAVSSASPTATRGDGQITILPVSPIAPDQAARMQAEVEKTIRAGGVGAAPHSQEDPAPVLAQIMVEGDAQRRFRLIERYVDIAISFPSERQAAALAALVDHSTNPDWFPVTRMEQNGETDEQAPKDQND